MYDKILLTTDGSEQAEKAIEHALSMAKKYDAEIHLLYVTDVRARMGNPAMDFIVNDLEEAGEEAIESLKEKIPEDVRTVSDINTGIPHKEILKYSGEEDINMICMSTHGRSGLDRMLIGSVTEKVIRKSDIPVLTVPTEE